MTGELLVSRRSDLVCAFAAGANAWREVRRIEHGSWPSAGPDGSILVTSVERTGEGRRAHLDVVRLSGERLAVPGSVTATFITPRLPIYSSWAPVYARLAFVASDGESIDLSTWSAETPDVPPRRLTTGMPLFHAWHPDGASLAVHAGEKLALFSPEGETLEAVSEEAAGFRVPAWSDDGRLLAWARLAGGAVEILIRENGQDTVVARYEGGIALAFRPGSRDLTVAVARHPETGAFDRLHVLPLGDEGGSGVAINGPFASFAWAPDGTRVAVVVPTQTGDGRYQTVVRAPDGAVTGVSEAVVPSVDTRLTLGFFDQYQLSQPSWSPDSTGLVICGRIGGDGLAASFGDPEGGYAYWWPGTRGSGLLRVSPAEVACFTPGRRPM